MKPLKMLITLALLSAALPVFGQSRGGRPQQQAFRIDTAFVNRFEAGTISLRGITLPYRLVAVGDTAAAKPAIVVYLHSRSANGNDNQRQVSKAAVKRLLAHLEASGEPALLWVPQCPDNRVWSERYNNGWQMTAVVKEVLDTLTTRHHADTHRLFLIGDSSGGAGVWRMLSDYPGLFAAAMVAASYPSRVNEKNAARTPLCCVIGDNDEVASAEKVQPTIKALQKRSGDVRFETLAGADHPQTARDAYTDENLHWVFAHSLP